MTPPSLLILLLGADRDATVRLIFADPATLATDERRLQRDLWAVASGVPDE